MAAVAFSTAAGAWEGAKEADLEEKSSRNFAWFQACSYLVGRQWLHELIALNTIYMQQCVFSSAHYSGTLFNIAHS